MIKKILIAGAGIGGLTAASCLMNAGYDVEIYEQAPELSEIGAGIQLSANAMHVLNGLGLGKAIAKLSVRPAAYVFRLHDTGEVIGQFPLAEEHERLNGAPYNQLHRADLHDLLAAKAVAGREKDIDFISEAARHGLASRDRLLNRLALVSAEPTAIERAQGLIRRLFS